jgi:hypothetical protein
VKRTMTKNEEIKIREFKILDKMGIEPYLIEYLKQQRDKQEIARKFN